MSSIGTETDDGTKITFRKYETTEMLELFTFMYENCVWGNDRSPQYTGSSGLGSYPAYNVDYIQFLKTFINDYNIGVINDLGCGTYLCGPAIYNDTNVIYNGYDVYNRVIDACNANSTRYNTRFFLLDFYNNMDQIPFCDLIILKDVLSYWSNECIINLLTYIVNKRLCKYILITNCCYQQHDNLDVDLGHFRPLNSQMSPLKDFGAVSLLKYRTKEVSLISLV